MNRTSRRKAYFKTLGCKANQCDTVALARDLSELGFEIVESPEQADVCVVNTCAVTSAAVRKSRQACRRALRLGREAKLFVMGCWPTAESGIEAGIRAAGVFQIEDRERIAEAILQHCPDARPVDGGESPGEPTHLQSDRTRHFVKIQDGCDQFCSYCIVPHLRGPMYNRAKDEILDEVRGAVAAGRKEIVLTGIRTGSWRGPTGETIVELIKRIEDETLVERIRISSIEPIDFTPGLAGLLGQRTRLCPHFHIPLQSASDRVLSEMNRGYTRGDYDAIVDRIRSAEPTAAISTDILVGYPTETDEDFLRTRKHAERTGFSRLHVFQFSPRPSTPAAGLTPLFRNLTAKQRSEEIISLGRKLQKEYHESFIGQELDVLVEAYDERSKRASGLSANYIRIDFPLAQSGLGIGDIVAVEITGAKDDGALGRHKGEVMKGWKTASSARSRAKRSSQRSSMKTTMY